MPDRYDNSYFTQIPGVFVTFAMCQAPSAKRQACLTMLSCSDVVNQETEINIRVHNASDHQMNSIILNGLEYGNLEPGEMSGYQKHELAYEIASVSLYVEDSNIQIIPIDYVGEKPLIVQVKMTNPKKNPK
jgi:hypothetical protein